MSWNIIAVRGTWALSLSVILWCLPASAEEAGTNPVRHDPDRTRQIGIVLVANNPEVQTEIGIDQEQWATIVELHKQLRQEILDSAPRDIRTMGPQIADILMNEKLTISEQDARLRIVYRDARI